jgi:hypothetical protein
MIFDILNVNFCFLLKKDGMPINICAPTASCIKTEYPIL